jgi:Flp pilus assembly protein CpaB
MLLLMAAAHAQETLEEVVAARRFLEPGVPITRDDIYVALLPSSYVPSHTFSRPEQVISRIPNASVPPDALVREERLLDPAIRAGLDALTPRGLQRVRVALPSPSRLVQPRDFVDVARIDDSAGCLLAAMLLVTAGERADGSVDTRLWDLEQPYVALHLVAGPMDAARIAATPPADLDLWLRNRKDVLPSTAPRCDPPPVATPSTQR